MHQHHWIPAVQSDDRTIAMAFVTPIFLKASRSRPLSTSTTSPPRRRTRAQPRPHARPEPKDGPTICPARMSGVNGGIDYEIDLSTLPSTLSARIRSVQQGADSPTDLINSANVIASAAEQYPSVIPVLVDMLGFNNPVAANICVSALSKAGTKAIPSLLTGVAAFNYAVNGYALRTLGLIGHASTLDICITCAEKGPIPGVRRAACKALGCLQFENFTQASQAFTILTNLIENESDWGVKYAAIVGVESFHSLHYIVNEDEQTIRDTLDMLTLLAQGQPRGDGSDNDAPVDPVAGARAAVALEVLTDRINEVNDSLVSLSNPTKLNV